MHGCDSTGVTGLISEFKCTHKPTLFTFVSVFTHTEAFSLHVCQISSHTQRLILFTLVSVCTHTHKHTHTHTHTHTHSHLLSSSLSAFSQRFTLLKSVAFTHRVNYSLPSFCQCFHTYRHTPSIAFQHLPPNSARFGYATEGALFISALLSSDTVSALQKVWVLIRQWKQLSAQAPT